MTTECFKCGNTKEDLVQLVDNEGNKAGYVAIVPL